MTELVLTFLILSFLDCAFIELSLKPLWQNGGYKRDAVRWYQIFLFGSVFLTAIALSDSPIYLAVLCLLWLVAGVEDVLYYVWLPLFKKIRGIEYDKFNFAYLSFWHIPRDLPWLGRHTGKWSWTTNWWLYGLSLVIFRNPNVDYRALLISVVLVVTLTLRYL